MKTFFRQSDWFLLAAALAAIYYFAVTYHTTYPEAALHGMIPRENSSKIAEQLLHSGIVLTPASMDSFHLSTGIYVDQNQVQYLQETYGLKEANRIMSSDIPAYNWNFTWMKAEDRNIRLSRNGQDEEKKPNNNDEEQVKLLIDRTGRPTHYSCVLQQRDSVMTPHGEHKEFPSFLRPPPVSDGFTLESARKTAAGFLKDVAGIAVEDFHENPFQGNVKNNRPSFEFSFTSSGKPYQQTQNVKIRIEDNKVSFFDVSFQPPVEFQPHKDRWLARLLDAVDIFIILFFAAITAIYFFIRFRSGAFDFKLGIFFGSIVGITFGIMIALTAGLGQWLIIVLIVVFAGGWYFFISSVNVSVAASLSHEVWPLKYQTFEALRRGRVWNQNFGISLLRGVLWSFILLGVSSVVLQSIPGTAFLLNQSSFHKFGPNSALFLICASVWTSIIYFHCFYLLTLSAIRIKIKSVWFIYAVGILIGLIYPYVFNVASPPLTRILLGLGLGAFFTFLFLRYDFLTLIAAGLLTYVIQEGTFLWYLGDMTQMSILMFFFVSILALGLMGVFSRETGEDILEYVPEYVREIENKQRMNREFEIARQIQSTLLCRSNPQSDVFEIASMCGPAYEVGGDYYDFITFADGYNHKVGVVIGDVSGKGVSAAFYMTLVKGIVQTQARITPDSTKATLCRVNDVFYDQIDRGKFISMIYAIFDFNKKKMIMSRAGHNPVLIKKTETRPETHTPSGIAIGLARGNAFSDSLEEIEVQFKPGDVFVFYTDGFSEAMNKQGEEYGEHRLAELIQKNGLAPAQAIVDTITKDVTAFVGSVPQHDDMTMIVVKIK
ncbi:SpoIIE family protein phosphatase [bacterium]|nr:SpoIIE family protein phosphatase [bacterium]